MRGAGGVGGLDHDGTGTVIVPQSERDRLRAGFATATVLTLERFLDGGPSTAPVEDWSEPDRNEVTVVLFTSGTTSRPKGVTHSINTLTSGGKNMALITAADCRTVIFLVSPLTSITGVQQAHLAADQHATLVLRMPSMQSRLSTVSTGPEPRCWAARR